MAPTHYLLTVRPRVNGNLSMPQFPHLSNRILCDNFNYEMRLEIAESVRKNNQHGVSEVFMRVITVSRKGNSVKVDVRI